MSQQVNTYLNIAFEEIKLLKEANEALAARVTQLETAATPLSRIVTEDGPNGPVIRRGRPPSVAAPDGTQ